MQQIFCTLVSQSMANLGRLSMTLMCQAVRRPAILGRQQCQKVVRCGPARSWHVGAPRQHLFRIGRSSTATRSIYQRGTARRLVASMASTNNKFDSLRDTEVKIFLKRPPLSPPPPFISHPTTLLGCANTDMLVTTQQTLFGVKLYSAPVGIPGVGSTACDAN